MTLLHRSLLSALRLILLAAGSLLPLHAQLPNTEPEVRRALPVDASYTSPTPISAPTTAPVPTPIPVMRALPVDTPAPARPRPLSVQPAVDLSPSTATPVLSPAAAPSSNSQLSTPNFQLPTSSSQLPASEESIRIAPSAAADPMALAAGQLELAEGLYSRKQPESAVPEYEKFLIMTSPGALGREKALYHLAEAQRLMGSVEASESTFQRLLAESPSGEYKAAAEFRLGELNETQGTLTTAAEAFSQAAQSAKDPAIVQAAHYREALCREKSGQKELATTLFEGIAKSTGANSYRTPSQLHLAARALDVGNKERALFWYSQILSTETPQTSGDAFCEAAVKSALIQNDLGKTDEARKLFDQVATAKEAGQWKSIAALGSLRLASQSGDAATVLKVAGIALAGDSENKPEILLLRANALHKLGKNAQALTDYDTILREYPVSQAASLAPFQRLLVLRTTHADSLLTEIDQFLLTASDPADRARTQLLKAEETLHRGKYKEAAALYHQIDTASLPPPSQTDILYKEAWALTQSGEKDAACEALTRFLKAYPKEDRAPTALAQRALLNQQKNDFTAALADFSALDEQYPKAPERELALQQKALLLGQQQDNKGMVAAFTILLHDYPKSTAAAQAHYWIGWAAVENKDYATAVAELSQARTGDPKHFGERAGLRILLADYYLNHPAEAAREAAAQNPSMVPPEIGRWLGVKSMAAGEPAKAERFLSPLVKEGLPGASDADVQSTLASSMIAQGKFKEAQAPAAACLKLSHDPASRARALLVAASIQRSMKNLQEASSLIDEAMLLQPEGPINEEARILSGDLSFSRQDYLSAAKAYITVAVLSADPVLTPKALAKAADAYRRAGNTSEANKAIAELQKRFPTAPVPAIPKS